MPENRACPFCKSIWAPEELGLECPKCKKGSFFTMRLGDIGTAMQFHAHNWSLDDFSVIPNNKNQEQKENE
ncbi:hypothetical protein [Vibrio porteresiae]|uniref:Uncharacterized protein n=1 Tax=Vibrio porteresiae DSM 19223 TaxID=1123496 RepID=A0ABZ0Q949_9VIBR|nr:hypothetical protein [Vibrio porteresiae]WPC72973.1 hypothetical protein R8Z52_12645 [Vibrio porteresiae DSM 19223]